MGNVGQIHGALQDRARLCPSEGADGSIPSSDWTEIWLYLRQSGADATFIGEKPHQFFGATMKQSTSTYLDLIRFSAAMIVVFHHLGGQKFTGGLGWQFIPFGAPAVDVFFVLSGYVITYAALEREIKLNKFLVNRFARIYSVAAPALIITLLIDTASYWLNYSPSVSIFHYVLSGLFLNQIWFINVLPGSNGPFWSLSYEIWYYVIFACATFASGRLRYVLTGLAMVIAGPRIVAMMPLWIMGVIAYLFVRSARLSSLAALLLWLASTASIVTAIFIVHRGGSQYPLLVAAFSRDSFDAQYLVDYAIGIAFSVNIACFHFIPDRTTKILLLFKHPARWLSGATFTMYITHYPISRFLIKSLPFDVGKSPQQYLVYGGTIFLVFLLAEVTERKKQLWRKGFDCILTQFSPRPERTETLPETGVDRPK